MRSYILILGIFFSFSYFVTNAYAYLDPGTGAMFISVIIGVLVGVGFTLRIYWHKLKAKIMGLKK